MPSIWMHIAFGQQLAEEFRNRFRFLSGVTGQRTLYQLGCQGPDFLLFHSFWPWKKDSEPVRLGNLMHTQNCGPFLIELWERAVNLPYAERQEGMLYAFGFLTHHLLDRNLHPYINWKAGYKHRNHQRFEIALDTVFMKKYKNIETWQTQTWKEIDVGPLLPASILSILHQTAASQYAELNGQITEQMWNEAYQDMVLAHKCLYDPAGWKKTILWGQTRRLFYQKLSTEEEQLDYLNEQRAEWRHSALYSEVRTDSVREQWEQALEDGRRVLEALASWLEHLADEESDFKLERFRRTLGDLSYDTGKECSWNLANLYAEPIWDTPRNAQRSSLA